MGNRQLDRAIARKLYEKFSKRWRSDLREQGLYGMPRSPKRPRFKQWYAMHAGNIGMMRESTPTDVREHLEIGAEDPWSEERLTEPKSTAPAEDQNRGVTTINIAGDEEG